MLMWIFWKVILRLPYANCFVEKYFESWDPKIHDPRNYLQSFYVATLIDKLATTNNDPPAIYRNGIYKETISSVTGIMDDGTPSSSSDTSTTSKIENNLHDTFKLQMKNNCLSLRSWDDELFKNGQIKPGIVLKTLKAMIDHEVDR